MKVMDYFLNVNGVDISFEDNSPEMREKPGYYERKRLRSYYEGLLKCIGADETQKRRFALDKLVDNLTEKSAKSKADYFEQVEDVYASLDEELNALQRKLMNYPAQMRSKRMKIRL